MEVGLCKAYKWLDCRYDSPGIAGKLMQFNKAHPGLGTNHTPLYELSLADLGLYDCID